MKVPFTREEAKKIGDRLGVNWKKTSPEWFYRGMLVELEHGSKFGKRFNVTKNNPMQTGRIAAVHEYEHPGYYKELVKMERRLSRRSMLKRSFFNQPQPTPMPQAKPAQKKPLIAPSWYALAGLPLIYTGLRSMVHQPPVSAADIHPSAGMNNAVGKVLNQGVAETQSSFVPPSGESFSGENLLTGGVGQLGVGLAGPAINRIPGVASVLNKIPGFSRILAEHPVNPGLFSRLMTRMGLMKAPAAGATRLGLSSGATKVLGPIGGALEGFSLANDPFVNEVYGKSGKAILPALLANPYSLPATMAVGVPYQMWSQHIQDKLKDEAQFGLQTENMANTMLALQRQGSSPAAQEAFISLLKQAPEQLKAEGPMASRIAVETAHKLGLNPADMIGLLTGSAGR